MPLVGFETTTPVFKRAEAVLALDRVATVSGYMKDIGDIFLRYIGVSPNYKALPRRRQYS
jgi:hypothetical protein